MLGRSPKVQRSSKRFLGWGADCHQGKIRSRRGDHGLGVRGGV